MSNPIVQRQPDWTADWTKYYCELFEHGKLSYSGLATMQEIIEYLLENWDDYIYFGGVAPLVCNIGRIDPNTMEVKGRHYFKHYPFDPPEEEEPKRFFSCTNHKWSSWKRKHPELPIYDRFCLKRTCNARQRVNNADTRNIWRPN